MPSLKEVPISGSVPMRTCPDFKWTIFYIYGKIPNREGEPGGLGVLLFNRTGSRQTNGPSGTHLLRAQPPPNMRVLGNHMASPSNRAFVRHPPPDHPYA